MEGPLDFESEDRLLSPPLSAKKRKKVIGLDDLLTDYYKEKGKVVERESKRAKARKGYNSDEDDDNVDEAKFHENVDQCQQMMGEISGEAETSSWGIQVFGSQQPFPPVDFPELGNCMALQSFMNNELNRLVELTPENGESFLRGLLVNGWLSKLAFAYGHVEKSIAAWTCNLIFYSHQEDLRTSACDFWVSALSFKNEVDVPLEIHWFPSYPEIKKALHVYGFLFDVSPSSAHDEAEELVGVIICLLLDRQLQGLLLLLHECLLSLIDYFTDEEWNTSCNRIAKFLALRVPRDVNCLQTVECISGINIRSKSLRSAVAYEILIGCFDKKITEAEEILRVLIKINVKDKSCDLFRMYIYLVLAENWILYNPLIDEKPLISEMWGVYLRNCSFQITGADLRSYASKVRTRATYLLQGAINT